MRSRNIIRRVFYHIKRRIFVKQFRSCAMSAGFGREGFGKDCTIIGKENMIIGENSWFGSGCEFIAFNSHMKQPLNSLLRIGSNVRVTSRARITCAKSVIIGDDVLIAPDCFITDHNHGTDPTVKGGYSAQPLIVKDVIIGDGAWLGQRVCVLPGVMIGKHSIIGAGSIVTHSIPEYCMAAGNPAKVIKKWNADEKQWKRV